MTKGPPQARVTDERAPRGQSPSPPPAAAGRHGHDHEDEGDHHHDGGGGGPHARVRDRVRQIMPLSAPKIVLPEGGHRAHQYTEEEWKKITAFSSITYLPLHTRIYKRWLQQNWVAREWDHWVMMALIGFFVGLLGSTLKIAIEALTEAKFERASHLLRDGRFGVMWLVTVLTSMALACASAVVVVKGEPAAGGSGIPDVMAYLNGVSIRRIFGAKALIVKFFSCVFAVSAGLYGGQEGPMIHMGAAMGKLLSQGVTSSRLPNIVLFKRFRNMYDRRNFISAGAAAGVASAFKAPIGGLLFVLEEISSFWTHKLAWQTFFCCGVATFTTQAFNSIYHTGSLGAFSGAVFDIEEAINSQLTMFLPTIGVGIIGGLFAALFTWGNLKICKWRNSNIVPRPWARIAEPVVVAFITTTLAVLIPYLFECMPSRCHEDPSLPGCNARYASSTVDEEDLVQYTCTAEGAYNPAATLFFTNADRTIEQLLSRHTHYQFDYGALVTLLIVYFSLCCYTAGMAPALGTMVPALLIGSVIGRIAGVGVTDIVGIRNSEAWSWVDPGGFALIGAAAFFGGLTRLTFSLAVVMIEITDETHFLLPIMTAVMVGKWTADALIDSLYHNLIELKCFPFLSDHPHTEECLDLHAVEDVMATNVVTIPEIGSVAHLARVLAGNTHRAFPVVEQTASGTEVFKGIILRNHVLSILAKEALFMDEDSPAVLAHAPSLAFEQAAPGGMGGTGSSMAGVTNAQMEAIDAAELVNLDDKMPLNLVAKNEGEKRALLEKLQSPEYQHRFVTLAPYIDQSSYRIPPSFSLERGFNLFRAMGLSHLAVVDKDNRVVGMVSRKDLTNINIHRKLECLRHAHAEAMAAHARGDEERGTGGGTGGTGGGGGATAGSSSSSSSSFGAGAGVGGQQGQQQGEESSGEQPRSVGGVSRSARAQADVQLQESHSEAIAVAGLDQGILI